MKYCINCGTQMKDEQVFCSNCGQRDEPMIKEQAPAPAAVEKPMEHQPEQIHEQEKEVQKSEKKPRRKLWLVIVAIVLALSILAAGVLWLLYYFSPEQRIIRLLNDDKIEEAVELYDTKDVSNTDALVSYINNRIDLLVSEFGAGSRSYDDTVAELELYREMELEEIQGDLAAADAAIAEIELSKENYAAAEKQKADQNYAMALKYYALVTKRDTQNYEAAQENIVTCQDAYREMILDEAKTYANKELYTDAIAKVDEGLVVLPDDKVLLETRNTYTQQVRTKVLDAAKAYASQGNYIDALKTLEDHRSDTEIDSTYKAYMAEYAALVKKAAEVAMSQSGYSEAMKIIEEAVRNFPNAKELTAIRDSYKELAPVYISSCSIMEDASRDLEKNKFLKDKYENKYSTSISAAYGSVTFLTANKYKSFTGIVSCPYDVTNSPAASARVTIYADDRAVFTSDWVFMTTAPQEFRIDLAGVQTVKLVWEYDSGGDWTLTSPCYRATIFDGAFNTY